MKFFMAHKRTLLQREKNPRACEKNPRLADYQDLAARPPRIASTHADFFLGRAPFARDAPSLDAPRGFASAIAIGGAKSASAGGGPLIFGITQPLLCA